MAGNKATYPDAAGPGADLVLIALPTGYRQELVLREKPAKPVEISLPVKGKAMQNWASGGNYGLELRGANEASGDDDWRELASAEYGQADATRAPLRSEEPSEWAADHRQGNAHAVARTAPARISWGEKGAAAGGAPHPSAAARSYPRDQGAEARTFGSSSTSAAGLLYEMSTQDQNQPRTPVWA
ncbi:hypothetical protein AB0K48_55705, partial [Nonomuraea sp. NPDC055795]